MDAKVVKDAILKLAIVRHIRLRGTAYTCRTYIFLIRISHKIHHNNILPRYIKQVA